MPIINPNNTTGLYGIDTTVQVNNTVTGNNLNIIGNAVIGGNVTVGGAISAAGNITGDYILGNGSQLTGLPEVYGNANVASYLSSGTVSTDIITTANVTGDYFIGDGSQLTGITTTYGNANVATFLASFGSNTISTTGNITGGYILGNGSQLTGLGATYNDGNVVTLLSNFGSNTIVTTGNITGGNFIGSGAALTSLTGANVTGTVANATYATTAGSATTASTAGTATFADTANAVAGANVTGTVANATYATSAGSATTATTAGTVTTAAQPNITSVGTLTSLTASGNISTGAYFLGDGSLLTGLPATYSNAQVATFLANFGSNTIVTTGNITGGNFIGSGAALTSITGANVTGTVANATYAATAGSATSATTATTAGTVTTAAQPNITSVGTLSSLSVSGNVTGGNINTAGLVSAAGNVTGANVVATTLFTGPQLITTGGSGNISGANYVNANYFVGDGSLLTNLPGTSPGGSNTQVQFNNSGAFGGDSLFTWNTATATAVIGNIEIAAADTNIQSVNAWNPNSSPQAARITVGTGYSGNYSTTYDPLALTRGSQLAVINKETIGNTDSNQSLRLTSSVLYADLAGGTLTNNNRRLQGLSAGVHIGNGSQNMTTNPYLGASGGGGVLMTGNISTATMGNIQLGHGSGMLNSVIFGTGSNIGNSVAAVGQFIGYGGQVGNAIGASSNFSSGAGMAADPTTTIGFYMPGTTNNYGLTNSNQYRRASNYYFLMNDDDVAQNKLGSLRSYTEYNGQSGTTSGSLTIDKTAGQVQQVDLTGAVTTLAFSNFVSSASDSSNTDEQCDTVTVIFNQGATGGYDVTFPSGSTYKYAGNVTALQGTTANSVSLVSISAIRIGGTTTYLITISPEFV